MKKRIFKYTKRVFLAIIIVIPILVFTGIYLGAEYHSGDYPGTSNWENDGPYIFLKNDNTLNIKYIDKKQNGNFQAREKDYSRDSLNFGTCYFPIDSTSFSFPIRTNFKIENNIYNDDNDILAISDLEGNYKTFRDFLIKNKVIDENLKWSFGKGHLVLVGDFVDRGEFVTQLLWFIYKLEQDAEQKGGQVHFIVGNHELKNMHGNYKSASSKYQKIASILGKEQLELYDSNSVIGKWLISKNAIELINGNLFVHGGIHPNIASSNLSLSEINQMIRESYYKVASREPTKNIKELILSAKTGPCWYRGYFKDDLTQDDVNLGLDKFNAKSVIVGHTLQGEVNRQYDGKVIGIDVSHPQDHRKHWPVRNSQALLIKGNLYYKVLENGEKEKI